MTTADYDILIVGGGLTGASLAARLGQSAWRVGLVDPRTPKDWPGPRVPTTLQDVTARVSALAPDALDWLQSCGIGRHLPPERLGHYHGMQVWDAEGSGTVHFDAAELNLPALGTLAENAWVERALWEELLNQPRVDVLSGVRAIEAQAGDASPASLMLDNGLRITTRLLVLADGARSPIRDQLGFRTERRNCHQRAVVATVEHRQSHGAVARQSFHRSGPLAFLPLYNEHWSSIVWSLDDNAATDFLELSQTEQQYALTRGIQGAVGEVTAMSPTLSFPLQQMHARDYWQPGVVLIGDTAHQLHPLAGQGANLGLRDACALYEILKYAENRSIALEEPLLLRRYTRQRQPHNLAALATMEIFQRLFAPEDPLVHSVRNLGMRAFGRQTLLRRTAIRMATGH